MSRKALEYDPIQFMVMTVCLKLGKAEEEVAQWNFRKIVRWMGFFDLQDRLEEEALKRAKSGG